MRSILAKSMGAPQSVNNFIGGGALRRRPAVRRIFLDLALRGQQSHYPAFRWTDRADKEDKE